VAGDVLRGRIEREDLVEEGMVGKRRGQDLLDLGEVEPDAGPVELADGDLDLDLERVAVDLFALALVLPEIGRPRTCPGP
jgi:hypothetical protein